MAALDEVKEIAGALGSYLTDVKKKSDRKMLGVMHPIVPQEVIYAAGMHPVRLFPMHQEPITLANDNLQTYSSSIFRAIWDQYLKGKFSFLEGLVLPESCETVTYFAPGWKWHRPSDNLITFTGVRFKKDQNARNFLVRELETLIGKTEKLSGQKVTVASLTESVKIYNRNRDLLRQIWELRKAPIPPLTGLEAFQVALVSLVMDKQENNVLLEALLEELKSRPAAGPVQSRILVSGPCLVDRRLFEAIESSGSMVVADDTNTGYRGFSVNVDAGQDLLDAIARCYSQIPCPFSCSAEDRYAMLAQLIADYKVDGVVFAVEKWCESEKMDYPYLEARIQDELKVPLTFVETEFLGDMAPIRTRIDGFLESLSVS